MSDRTVPPDAEDYKTDGEPPRTDKSHVDRDPIVDKAEDHDDEFPNRDDDEFKRRHLKEPKLTPDVQEDNDPDPPPRGEEGDPHSPDPKIDPDGTNN